MGRAESCPEQARPGPWGPRYVTGCSSSALEHQDVGHAIGARLINRQAFPASKVPSQGTYRPAYVEPLFRGCVPTNLGCLGGRGEERGGEGRGRGKDGIENQNLGIEHLLETLWSIGFYFCFYFVSSVAVCLVDALPDLLRLERRRVPPPPPPLPREICM